MQNKMEKAGNLRKDKNSSCLKVINVLVASVLLSSFVFICFNAVGVSAGISQYTPASPTGSISTDINIENEYTIFTSEAGSSWMFDWGDGSHSDWIEVGAFVDSISQSHSWSSYGEYEVKVKHSSVYMAESAWSSPLVVKVTLPTDPDGDGYSNDIEIAYGTDQNDPNKYPSDTDGDGTFDGDSQDGNYVGDTDDDNDGVSDILEEKIGSSPKNFDDITLIVLNGPTYCLADTDGDGESDVLYNFNTGLKTGSSVKGDTAYLDTNGDGRWEYTYSHGVIRKQPFEIPLLYVLFGIVLIILLTLFVLFKKGVLFLYQEEYVAEE